MNPSAENKVRVLLVDDESGFTRTVKLALDSTGKYDVEEVNEATEAVAAAKRFHPHIVFCDIVMPEMDGGDVAAAIRDVPSLSKVPIIFLTAIVAEHEAGRGMIGGFPFLPKPVSLERLMNCIEEHMGRPS